MYCAGLQRMKMEGFPSTWAHPAPVFSKEARRTRRLGGLSKALFYFVLFVSFVV
jgi:hypothetical protein